MRDGVRRLVADRRCLRHGGRCHHHERHRRVRIRAEDTAGKMVGRYRTAGRRVRPSQTKLRILAWKTPGWRPCRACEMPSALFIAVIILLLVAVASAVLFARDVGAARLRQRVDHACSRREGQAQAAQARVLAMRSAGTRSDIWRGSCTFCASIRISRCRISSPGSSCSQWPAPWLSLGSSMVARSWDATRRAARGCSRRCSPRGASSAGSGPGSNGRSLSRYPTSWLRSAVPSGPASR